MLVLIIGASCQTKSALKDDFVVKNSTDFEAHTGKKVVVEGIYRQMNVNKRVNGNPTYIGRAQLELSDGMFAMIETHDKGIRTPEEIALYEGKIVRVTGKIGLHCLAWGNGEVASIVGHCITDISEVKLAP